MVRNRYNFRLTSFEDIVGAFVGLSRSIVDLNAFEDA